MAKKRLIQFLILFLVLAPLAVLADNFIDFTLLWNRIYDSSRDEFIFDLDAKSNIHIAGYTYNGSNNDYLIMKYNNQGDLLWQKTYDGGYNNNSYGDRGQGIVVDTDAGDDVYVTGNSATDSYSRVGTLKYAGGNDPYVSWIYDIPNNSCQGDTGYHITIDSNYVYVVGASCTGAPPNNNQWDYLVLKYDKTGNLIWDKTFDGGGGRDSGASDGGGDKAFGVAVDGSGNIYVTGRSYNGSNYDFWTMKLDSGGNKVWDQKINYGANDYGYRVVLDGQNNVYVAGVASSGGIDYAFIRKYNNTGNTIWSYILNYPYSGFLDIDIDNNNNLYLGGYIWTIYYDYLAVKMDSNGNIIWLKTYDSGNANEASYGIGVDSQKNVYLSGYRVATTNDALTIKYAKPCGGPFSGINFTDSVLTAGQTLIKKLHFDELRWDVNVLRDNAELNTGVGWYNFTDAVYGYLGNFTPIRATHINELRQKLGDVYTQCAGSGQPPTYTDPTLTSGQTPVRKTHVDQLRQAIQNAQ
ncbi:hypothetical protein HZB06_02070 [Candidatus Wolfebacteria bacterium]|nr:hypothetical protein [Candidatus Wolfebacteria bacterium]